MLFLAFLIALVVTMVLIPPLMRAAVYLRAIDMPDERKVHTRAIPRIGGVAMVAGAVLPILFFSHMNQTAEAFLYGIGVLLVFGFLDDRYNLKYWWKFLGQFIAVGLVVFYGGVEIQRMTFGGVYDLPQFVAIPLTVIFLVGITNAINLADGLDGLAGGTTLLSIAAIALLAQGGGENVILFSIAVVGATLGFLRFNTHPAQLFMGDTGSQFLGFSAGTLSVLLTQHANMALSPMLPLLLLGLPILDTLAVMTQRIYERRSPFAPDKNHIHHKLLALGFDHYEAVSLIYLAVAVLVSSAYLLRYQSDGLILVSYVGFCTAVLTLFHLANKWHWRMHHSIGNGASLISGSIQRLRLSGWMQKGPQRVLSVSIPAVFLLGAIIPQQIPTDFATAGAMLIVVFGFILLRWRDPQQIGVRASIYVTAAFVVYLLESAMAELGEISGYFDYFFYGLAVVVAISIRFSERRFFQITPLDLLVLFLALVAPMLPTATDVGIDPRGLIIKLVILFYACELLISRMRRNANVLNISALVTLGIIVVRGF